MSIAANESRGDIGRELGTLEVVSVEKPYSLPRTIQQKSGDNHQHHANSLETSKKI